MSCWKVEVTPRQTASRSHVAGATGCRAQAPHCVKIAGSRPQHPLPSRQRFGHHARSSRCHIARQRSRRLRRSARCHRGNVRTARKQPLPHRAATFRTSRRSTRCHPGNVSDITPAVGRCHITRQRFERHARSTRCHPGNVSASCLWLLCLTRTHPAPHKTNTI